MPGPGWVLDTCQPCLTRGKYPVNRARLPSLPPRREQTWTPAAASWDGNSRPRERRPHLFPNCTKSKRISLSWVFKLYPGQKRPGAQNSWTHTSILAPGSSAGGWTTGTQKATSGPFSPFPFLQFPAEQGNPMFPLRVKMLTHGIHFSLSGSWLFSHVILSSRYQAWCWACTIQCDPAPSPQGGVKGTRTIGKNHTHNYMITLGAKGYQRDTRRYPIFF